MILNFTKIFLNTKFLKKVLEKVPIANTERGYKKGGGVFYQQSLL